MDETVQEFLKRIGPRRLTEEEAGYLQLLRIREGHDDELGFVEMLAERARKKSADAKPTSPRSPDSPETEPGD